jgi:DNA repair protein RecN (Recombination protein N)
MLIHLEISNYLLIRDLSLDFDSGFIVLTGETGAGKSMILGAIDVLMGKSFSKDSIRKSETKAVIEGIFKLENCEALQKIVGDIYFEDLNKEILIRREISQNGRTRTFLNDQPLPQSRLNDIREHLLDIHGQRENQSLYRSDKQLEFLDVFAGALPDLQEFRKQYRLRSELNRVLFELKERFAVHMREQSLLAYQLEEIERLGLTEGEEEAIEAKLRKLENAEKLREQSQLLHSLLNEGENAISDQIGQARSIARELARTDQDLSSIAAELKNIESQIKDIGEQIRDYSESVDMDEAELEALRERRGVLWDLKRKHGMNLNEIIARAGELKGLLAEGETMKARIESVQAELDATDHELISSGESLSAKRRAAASKLSKKVEEYLQPFGFSKARFKVQIDSDLPVKPNEVGKYGADRVRFLFSANVGSDPTDLAEAASGGEASRVMLAIKSVLADKIQYPLMIFDEIDLGISGQIAERVGGELSKMGSKHQLIVISHLPQIASKADHHLFVQKQVVKDNTEISARFLENEERVTAVAALLAGKKITKQSLASADELINQHKPDKAKTIG